MRFTKMQGCGNDYIYIDGSREKAENKAELARVFSDRHFGIGGDGVIFINPSEKADFEMEMYNADGSRGRMCGNGIRCVAKYVYDKGLTDKNPLTIESFGAVKTLFLTLKDGKVDKVRVDMGEPILKASLVPVLTENTEGSTDTEERLIDTPLKVNGEINHITAVSMGNPHAVVYVDDPGKIRIEDVGPHYEHHPAFPEGVNTEFIRVVDRSTLEMRVWERGSGETFACGTGACAAAVASVLNGKTDRKVTVHLLGGDLLIEWDESDNHVYMTGPAVTVFEGEAEWDDRKES
ncbi:MAG: diaminopimelate epimerase [Lachnospiraceae bacterium]|nr:diaminopimelate epimerase [Lachnospiraceae bacterium]